MKWFLLWLGLGVVAVAGAADAGAAKAARVEQLKKDFPRALAPGAVEKMHPVARECFERFAKLAEELQAAQLSKQSVRLAAAVDRELLAAEVAARNGENPFGAAGRSAARFNARWLREKVSPWVRRVASEARR
jgi:hypothetical protein